MSRREFALILHRHICSLSASRPGSIRVMMGYVIDLTAVLEGMFHLLQSQARSSSTPSVSMALIDIVVEGYAESPTKAQCHFQIKKSVERVPSIIAPSHQGYVMDEIVRLIHLYRFHPDKRCITRAQELMETDTAVVY